MWSIKKQVFNILYIKTRGERLMEKIFLSHSSKNKDYVRPILIISEKIVAYLMK
jgi:hypothetical protein